MKKRQRIEYWLVGMMMIALFVGSIFLTNYFFKKELLAQQEEYLQKKGNLILDQLSYDLFTTEHFSDQEKKLIAHYATDKNERLTLMTAQGTIFYDSIDSTLHESRSNRPEIKAILSGADFGSALRKSATLKEELLYLALPVEKEGELIGILRMSEETTQFSNSIQSFRRYILFTFGLLFLIITAFVFLLLHQKNEPLVTVLPVLKKIVQYPDEARSIIQDSPEWNELYQTVNLLSQQMSQTYLAYTSTDEQFHALLDELMIGVFIIDVDGKLQLINPKMATILMLKERDAGNDYFEVIKEPALIHLIHQVITEKSSIHQEIKLTDTLNETILDMSLRFIEEDGNDYQVLGIAYDLTRVRQLEKMQKDFVSNVSHELKTPVTSLLGFTETLLDGAKDDPETLTQFLEIMQNDALRLQQLIQEILQLSRDGKNISYDDQEVILLPFVQEILRSYRRTIAEKSLTIEILGDDSIRYITKYEVFYPIVKNLIENAIQYSQTEGTITIDFGYSDMFFFSVKDLGIGISPKDQERIFERFYRVDKARSRHSGGTGLGLSIVHNYTELLGGTVSIDSHLGLGSTFIVKLPKNE
ncbi:sensory box histidine kinase [Enterococcus moraviensis ATCC BAA-383]|uniref:histidine kinase n=1 Tax=Enterococcus moraviensis ATCC BAA-383 TaxID=1158609 RepID=R2QYS0_9ENTE|nr:ATP-binding protein [Enterococcus moraviensis]EOI00536.1 sensory box histidine kinase [Enterococcus moraviensis ATCC BAA-383]EOT73235.1 sensory box histidine kinase [Enterococcus moraviensis ATCC BAA-383]